MSIRPVEERSNSLEVTFAPVCLFGGGELLPGAVEPPARAATLRRPDSPHSRRARAAPRAARRPAQAPRHGHPGTAVSPNSTGGGRRGTSCAATERHEPVAVVGDLLERGGALGQRARPGSRREQSTADQGASVKAAAANCSRTRAGSTANAPRRPAASASQAPRLNVNSIVVTRTGGRAREQPAGPDVRASNEPEREQGAHRCVDAEAVPVADRVGEAVAGEMGSEAPSRSGRSRVSERVPADRGHAGQTEPTSSARCGAVATRGTRAARRRGRRCSG